MEKVLLKHVTGSKANSTESFDLPLSREIVLGRDPSAQIQFDAVKDDLVSRLHARISQDPGNLNSFSITDLGSRNGTFVNGKKISATTKLGLGDAIQLGNDGPKMEFDLDPRPALAAPATREVSFDEVKTAMTRESQVPPLGDPSMTPPPSNRPSGAQATSSATGGVGNSNTIGRATVERLITQTKSSNRKFVSIAIAAVASIVVILSGLFMYNSQQEKKKQAEIIERNRIEQEAKLAEEKKNREQQLEKLAKAEQQATAITTAGATISEKNIPSTVYIEASWKLIEVNTGKQVYHRFATPSEFGMKGSTRLQPVYRLQNNVLEPELSTDSNGGKNKPIGRSNISGSGFVVKDNGFILTNKHIVAGWETEYFENKLDLPGLVINCQDAGCSKHNVQELGGDMNYPNLLGKLAEWTPANTMYLGGKPVEGKRLEGRLDSMTVTFPKSTVPTRATLERVSDSADVALIKIQLPDAVPPVRMCESNCLNVGEMVTVLGYPEVSAEVYAKGPSYSPGMQESSVRKVPDVTVTRGNVQKIVKGDAGNAVVNPSSKYASRYGDVYQLAINTVGSGNSGGPVFNDKGEVVGIFTYALSGKDRSSVSLAVPIKHGRDLMEVQRVIK